MKRPHFYKANCRLGLLNIPYGSNEFNRGVEEGPDSVITEEFLNTFSQAPAVDSFTFSNPDIIEKSNYQEIIAKEYKAFADLISSKYQEGETQVVVGGDHSVTFSSFLALSERIDPKDIAYIQFDSHADIHSFRTSPSGNFHGMYMRAFVDDVASPSVQQLVRKKLPIENILYIGNHVNEEEEWDFLRKNNVQIIDRPQLLNETESIHQKIKDFSLSRKHVHISFDVDVFDKSIQPATGILVEDGFFPGDVFPIFSLLAQSRSLSFDLVEINPRKDGALNTIALSRKLIGTLCK